MDINRFCLTGGGNKIILGTAASKAPQDVCSILEKYGYKNLYLTVGQEQSAIKRMINKFIQLYKISRMIPNHSIILMQYPLYTFLFFTLPFYRRCIKKQLLIHDIDSIRINGKLSWLEKITLSQFDEIIVHTNEMKNYLERSLSVQCKIYVLFCFDYLVDNYCFYGNQRSKTYNLCFAGNIDKSVYLQEFLSQCPSMHLYLYGSWSKKVKLQGNFEYMGKFTPSDVGYLEGSWGIVWDGDTAKTCNGTWGEYLRIIASHKVSLYIVSGLPLIVWKQSAMAKFVEKEGLGLLVDSLLEVGNKIADVSDEQYQYFICNLQKWGDRLNRGAMLESVLNDIK